MTTGRRLQEAAVADPGWNGALKALAELLAAGRPDARARVVLSHHFAPVYLLPATPVRLSHAELLGWARERLVSQFGESARNWQLVAQAEPPGDPFLVSTLPPERLSELDAVLATAGVRAIGLQPWLAVACNRYRASLGRGTAWLALAEPGRLTLARMQGGRFRALRSALTGPDPVRDLADMMARESLLEAEGTQGPVWLSNMHVPGSWQALAGRIELRQLGPAEQGMAAMLGT